MPVELREKPESVLTRKIRTPVGSRVRDRNGPRLSSSEDGLPLVDTNVILDRIAIALEQFLGRVSGVLKVGASTIPGEYVLPPLIGRYREKYPQVTIALQIGDSRGIAEAVLAGQVELGVVGAKPDHRAADTIEFMPDELVVVVPPGHPWVGRRQVTLDDLKPEPLIVREAGSGSREALETALNEVGSGLAGMRVIAELGSTSAVKQAVKAGVGISIISKRAVEEECQHGLLWGVKLRDLRFTRQFYVITHAGRSRSPLCQAFLEFLRAAR